MKFLSWNVRGFHAPDKLRLIKRVVDQAKVDVVFLQETKLSGDSKVFLSRKLISWQCLMIDANGTSTDLGFFWKESSVNVSLIDFGSCWKLVLISSF